MDGAIYAASIDGIEYIKFTGTVRYSHCSGLESHINQLFADKQCTQVVVDLEQAEVLDSTALGLLAKVAIEMKKYCETRPVIFMVEGELHRIINRVCFDQVFDVVFDRKPLRSDDLEALNTAPSDEESVLKRVIGAHRSLAELSESNESLYRDITGALG